jgi:transcriptional regulator with XRE-family HTH domain
MAYGESMRSSDIAGFAPALGARLRELRRRAGLSLVELAHLMGREPAFYSYLSRLEHGRVRYPSLVLVADYLRACRASFADIGPVLDRYTGLPPAREPRAREAALAGLAGDGSRDAARLGVYDRKTAEARRAAGQKPVPAVKRAAALSRQLCAAREQREVARVVEEEVGRLGLASSLPARKLALDYGRMVWRAMKRTEGEEKSEGRSQNSEARSQRSEVKSQGAESAENHPHPLPPPQGGGNEREGWRRRGRPRKTREARLAEAEARIRELGPGIVPIPSLRQIGDAVVRLWEAASRNRETTDKHG